MRDSERSSAGSLKQFLWDISGAFGDIGVLYPIAITLITRNRINPFSLFLIVSLFCTTSSYYFKFTMHVQPLKVMSTTAISTGLSYEVINSAGIMMGIILLIIFITGISIRLGNIFPVSVIKGYIPEGICL